MINVGYKDKIFCGNSVSILKSFYFCICRSKLNYDYDRLYSYNFSYLPTSKVYPFVSDAWPEVRLRQRSGRIL